MSIDHLKYVRQNTVKFAKSLDQEQALITPEGFNNNSLWNLGHIYIVHENLVMKASGREPIYPDGYVNLFKPGTRPSEWNEALPTSLEQVISHLEEQGQRFAQTFEGHLDETIPEPVTFPKFPLSTVRDLINFALAHETAHLTTIKLYKRLLATSSSS
ncbi:DinB family protein [Pullulanibacillus sp. KACC 23026]|uniref:DinB family protein n=1 Tax=Pullulanibacillus sp. KACC 23026 TaxID=3028315 RepID=UPI0023B15555|nr:DinB family protein [Pullulanibacillus sp. KACC 23026]WEG10803.1 DinB family protein [Pullulanibacillus sp. KACC 23026]